MIYLLDTHTFIWALLDTQKLSQKVKELLCSKKREIFVSTVSFWEISLKTRIKKFSFDNISIGDFPRYAREADFTVIDMQESEAISYHELPLKKNHKDPFDRMLIWQAISKNMALISKDTLFEQYCADGLKLIW